MANCSDKLVQRSIHAPLVRCRGIATAHWHYCPFIHAKGSRDGGVLCLEIGICHVNLPPDFSFCAVSENVVDVRQGILVRYRVAVQFMVVVYPSR